MFDKWEEKELSAAEANALIVAKQAKYVRPSGPDRVIVRVKKGKPEAPQEAKTEEEVPREKVPGRVEFEINREKDARNVTVKKSNGLRKLSPRREFYDMGKRRFYLNHIIKETIGGKVRYFIRWNYYLSEAYDKDGKITYDPSLENHLMNDMESQLGKAVGAAVGFVFERPMIIILVMAMVFGIPIGLSYNDIFHWVPNTVVHWVPRT